MCVYRSPCISACAMYTCVYISVYLNICVHVRNMCISVCGLCMCVYLMTCVYDDVCTWVYMSLHGVCMYKCVYIHVSMSYKIIPFPGDQKLERIWNHSVRIEGLVFVFRRKFLSISCVQNMLRLTAITLWCFINGEFRNLKHITKNVMCSGAFP